MRLGEGPVGNKGIREKGMTRSVVFNAFKAIAHNFISEGIQDGHGGKVVYKKFFKHRPCNSTNRTFGTASTLLIAAFRESPLPPSSLSYNN
jgi:hypothetical protein